MSSRVLLVSNLSRSNWKCTVKRFFKSTVMINSSACAVDSRTQAGGLLVLVAPICRCRFELISECLMCVTQNSTSSPFLYTQIQLFAFAVRRNNSLYPYLLAAPTANARDDLIISLRLLALILCSNCSNTFNKVLTLIEGLLLNYFLQTECSLELALNHSHMVMAFHTLP